MTFNYLKDDKDMLSSESDGLNGLKILKSEKQFKEDYVDNNGQHI